MIRSLEELSANAWPGLGSTLVDGWISRFAAGYSRRANSVLPLYPGSTPLSERIARCEALARAQGIEPAFKLTPASLPEDLDAELDRRGYRRETESSVMVLPELGQGTPSLPAGFQLRVTERVEEDWLAFHEGQAGRTPQQIRTARAILEQILPSCRFLLLQGATGPAACALAVVEDGWAGIFEVMVRADLRGRGLGRTIMAFTTAQAASAGGRQAYLQVVRGNRPAEQLYLSLGYRVAYPYWFRVKTSQP